MFYSTLDEFRDSAGHIIDGQWYPRVTKIVDIKSKPALYRFYSAVGWENGEKIKEQSASEGTLVHAAVEKLLVGQEPDIADSIRPAADAFRRFLSEHRLEAYPELIEKRVVHPNFRYSGTVDALVNLDGRFGILDIKTSKAIYRDYDLQTAAYFDALKDIHPNLSTRWILRLDQLATCFNCGSTRRFKGGREKISPPPRLRNGLCKKEEHVWSDPQGIAELKEASSPVGSDFEAFLAAKRLWEWEHEFLLRRLGYL